MSRRFQFNALAPAEDRIIPELISYAGVGLFKNLNILINICLVRFWYYSIIRWKSSLNGSQAGWKLSRSQQVIRDMVRVITGHYNLRRHLHLPSVLPRDLQKNRRTSLIISQIQMRANCLSNLRYIQFLLQAVQILFANMQLQCKMEIISHLIFSVRYF